MYDKNCALVEWWKGVERIVVIWSQYQRNSELIALARIYEAHEIYAAYRSHPRS